MNCVGEPLHRAGLISFSPHLDLKNDSCLALLEFVTVEAQLPAKYPRIQAAKREFLKMNVLIKSLAVKRRCDEAADDGTKHFTGLDTIHRNLYSGHAQILPFVISARLLLPNKIVKIQVKFTKLLTNWN